MNVAEPSLPQKFLFIRSSQRDGVFKISNLNSSQQNIWDIDPKSLLVWTDSIPQIKFATISE